MMKEQRVCGDGNQRNSKINEGIIKGKMKPKISYAGPVFKSSPVAAEVIAVAV